MSDEIIFTREKHLGLITLNRPAALNALTLPMILAMQEQLQAWEEDKNIAAVAIRASEGKAFCAGGDVRWLYETGKRRDPQQMQFFWHEYRLNHFIHHFKKPYIALLDGVTMGGGVGISLHGSHPVATERFIFAMPETTIGFFPDVGASYLLARCPGQLGIYLGLTGNRLQTLDAYALGLIRYSVSSAQIGNILDELIAADLSYDASCKVNSCLQKYAVSKPDVSIKPLESFVNSVFQYETVEHIFTALAKQEDEWYVDTLNVLQQKAPLSLKVTLTQIRQAKRLDLAACLQVDYALVHHFMRDHDFYEGVRALLVDKDKSPRWNPATLSDVSELKVQQYFEGTDNLFFIEP
ncbi:enoyl-CoA hydratase/isomerase family protein [Legionella septentrionalis]|uniref:3-hydroxyisobutyryl-CoA hydrolase n=1 Tax=Legionella septentrionalis TaxID=2498109 RepID=A0A3S0VM98_9GAMM|nr:enoyl-CoA hydratase/isomerase family protein [Legionella septentrionalis]RUQ81606.1 enoyl-CoA hydratase/isomerase family protein [Legionella septentrionalis]